MKISTKKKVGDHSRYISFRTKNGKRELVVIGIYFTFDEKLYKNKD
jgi:hypothetical protein